MLFTAKLFAESFHQGGWPMYPILLLGILLILAAGKYAAHPDTRQLQLVRCLGAVTIGFGFLGTILGMIHCLGAMAEVPLELVVKISMLGLGESLNNLSLALLLGIIAGLLTAVGALRDTERLPVSSQ